MPARRTLLRGALGAAAVACPAIARAQSPWPDRPVRLVVPYPPGGATDVIARVYAERVGAIIGQPVVIDNRPGASGNIGIDAVAKSPADGYTFGAGTVSNFSINQYLYKRVPYDIERDLKPVALAWEFPNVVVVPANRSPAKTLAEFIAWAKAQPKGVVYGSTGVGTTTHLSSSLFFSRIGVEATHVPFRGASQTIPAMLAGDVDFAIDGIASYIELIKGGQIRALAITSAERWPSLPEVPTMAEAGMADFVVTVWGGFVVPAATPKPVVDKLNDALRRVVDDPAQRQRIEQTGAKPIWTTPERAAARAAAERPMWRQLVQTSGAEAD